MGRTIPSFRIALESEISTWGEFRGSLGHQSKDLLDNLFNQARTNCASAGMAVRPVVFEGMFMAMLHSHDQSLAKISRAVEEIRLELGSE